MEVEVVVICRIRGGKCLLWFTRDRKNLSLGKVHAFSKVEASTVLHTTARRAYISPFSRSPMFTCTISALIKTSKSFYGSPPEFYFTKSLVCKPPQVHISLNTMPLATTTSSFDSHFQDLNIYGVTFFIAFLPPVQQP